MNREPQGAVNIDRWLVLLRRRGPIVLVCTLIAAASAFAFARHQHKQYTATASVLFSNNQLGSLLSGLQQTYQPLTTTQQDTNVRLVGLGDIAQRTAQALGHGWSPGGVKAAINISADSDTSIVLVAGTTSSPRSAARVANTYAQTFVNEQQESSSASIALARNLYTRQYNALSPAQRAGTQGLALQDKLSSLQLLSQLNSNVSIAGKATPPSSPSAPKTSRDIALGAVLGLLIGLAIAFLLERMDRRIRDPKELARAYELPLLGMVPERDDYSVMTSLGQAMHTGGMTLYDEVFNLLRSYLRYFAVDRDLRTLLVISAGPGEGKTTVSYNLAKSAAALGTRVLLVEADLRRGTQIGSLLDRADPSLADVLIGEAAMEDAVRSIEVGPKGVLDVLIAGDVPPPNAGELIESHAMESLLERAAANYELVVIDTPPLTLIADAIPLLTQVDGVIVVGRVGTSRRDTVEHLRAKLHSLRAPVLGVVANGVRGRDTPSYGGSYRYGSYPHAPHAGAIPAVSNGHGHADEAEIAARGDVANTL